MTPYTSNYQEEEDLALITQAFEGSANALNKLINRHQQFIYNVALKFIGDQDDAADLTQEVLITIVTKLDQFQGKSSFRTWLYRMVVNHFLNTKRKKKEAEIVSFEKFGVFIDEVYNDEEMTREEEMTYDKEITWTRNRCMVGKLVCLDRQQRMVFILGSVFNLKSNLAAEILDITPENFRKQLQRAKADLFNFMDNKCGLINPANPCRCPKKTKGYIKDGTVSAATMQFYQQFTDSIESVVEDKNREMDYLMEHRYLYLFTDQPYEQRKDNEQRTREMLQDPLVKKLFKLN